MRLLNLTYVVCTCTYMYTRIYIALSSWDVHHPTHGGPKKEAERDFVALNKASVECGLTTAHEQTHFRATHDIRRRDDEGRRSSTAQAKFPPDMVFGISTR